VTHNPNNFEDADKADRDNATWMKYLLLDAEQVLREIRATDEPGERTILTNSMRYSIPEVETILFERWRACR
jgi:hypothetical protein